MFVRRDLGERTSDRADEERLGCRRGEDEGGDAKSIVPVVYDDVVGEGGGGGELRRVRSMW